MYNLIKLQKHDAFYQSREGGKCSIKCFNADLQCHTTKAVENISHSCPRMETRKHTHTHTHTHKVIPKASYAAR